MLWFKKKTEPKPEPKEIRELKIVYPDAQENADRFFRFYRDELIENPDYDMSARDLKESFYREKVFRYDRFELPYKIEDGIVYSLLEDSWLKVGTLKRKIPDGSSFYLFPNIYKYVSDSVEKESGDHYFGFEIEIKKKVGSSPT